MQNQSIVEYLRKNKITDVQQWLVATRWPLDAIKKEIANFSTTGGAIVDIKPDAATSTHNIEKVEVVKEKKADLSLFDRFILKLTKSLSHLAFLTATAADLFLAMFFYYSLGFDESSKIILAIWGIVQTGSKIWAWSNRKKLIAIWCAALSVFATFSLFLAVLDIQSKNIEAQNTVVEKKLQELNVSQVIQSQIIKKQVDIDLARKRRDENDISNYQYAVRRNEVTRLERDLTNLQNQYEAQKQLETQKPVEIVKEKEIVELRLSAWHIFNQVPTVFNTNASRLVAILIILALAILLELMIAVTTPKK